MDKELHNRYNKITGWWKLVLLTRDEYLDDPGYWINAFNKSIKGYEVREEYEKCKDLKWRLTLLQNK